MGGAIEGDEPQVDVIHEIICPQHAISNLDVSAWFLLSFTLCHINKLGIRAITSHSFSVTAIHT